jgi:excisionase family DNA binding protein
MGELILLHGPTPGARLLSKTEAAVSLGVSERTVDRYRRDGLQSVTVGGRRWFPADAVEAWRAGRRT